MYQLNLLPRKVLITPDEVIAQGPTGESVDPRNLLKAIQIAEERFIKKVVCKDLYVDFCNKKNVVVTSINKAFLEAEFTGVTLEEGQIVNAIELVDNAWYKTLWNEHLWKLIAECVIYTASPTNWLKSTTQGEMLNNPKSIAVMNEGSGAVSGDIKDVQWKMTKLLQDRIDPLIASLQEFMCDNRGYFPLYNCKKCGADDSDGVSMLGKTAFVHGIYNDSRRDSCCEN